MAQVLDARYVLTPITNLYELFQEASKKDYPIFDANIREYLGATGAVNKGIMKTLKDPEDRLNFFYYNNGVTMIVEDMTSASTKGSHRVFTVKNPQIVNGCQTVSTINETLAGFPPSSIEQEFSDTYVMLKILKIPSKDSEKNELYQRIVTYNNSQNAISQKTFVANSDEFRRIQTEFERKGFLVCIKQSDKHKFLEKYKTATSLLTINSESLNKFGLSDKNKTKDLIIDLEKFLQIILAFTSTTQDAVQNKSKLLKPYSDQNRRVIDFIKNSNTTINSLIDLYLLYLRATEEKKKSSDGRTPIPLYLINCFSYYDCDGKPEEISKKLETKEDIDKIINIYKGAINGYQSQWRQTNGDKDYNTMIKTNLDRNLMNSCRSMAISMQG